MLDDATKQEVKQAVQDAVQGAAQQTAAQVAQQIAEQVSQGVSQGIQKFMQTTGATTVGSRQEMADIGGSEAHERGVLSEAGILFANKKRTFDEYQEAGLESIKRNQRVIEQAQAQLQSNLSSINNVSLQLLQHATENANILGKKVAENVGKSGDIATDRMWNPDEQGYQVASIIDSMNAPAVKQAMAATIAEILAAIAKKPA